MEDESRRNKTDILHTKVQLYLILVIYMGNDIGNCLNVHILELFFNERALKIYFPKLHNSFTLLTLSNLLNLNMEGLPQ